MFLMTDNKWARLLAVVTGLVNQKLLLQNEYLAAENRILRAHLPARMRLSDPQRSSLAEIAGAGGRRRQLQEREMDSVELAGVVDRDLGSGPIGEQLFAGAMLLLHDQIAVLLAKVVNDLQLALIHP